MVVVIRLQGLKITAGTEDIRAFFTGLKIPDGGVHIIGGNLEEAFIIFTSDEDARRAMTRSGGCIRGSPVNLLLSSKSEMHKVLEENTRQPEANRRPYRDGVKRPVAERRSPSLSENMRQDVQEEGCWNVRTNNVRNDPRSQMKDDHSVTDRLYVYLSGMPFAATKEDVYAFFDGLQVDDVLFLQGRHGTFNGTSLVKFGNLHDATEGMKRDRKYMGPRYIRVLMASERQWIKLGGFVEPKVPNPRRRAPERSRSRSPVHHRSRSPSSEELFVLYENLPYSLEKRDVKALIHPVALTDEQITIFVDKNRSKSVVVVFKTLKDYCSGLTHHKETFRQKTIYASPISKEKIATMVDSAREQSRRSSKSSERSRQSPYDTERRYLYVRNLPFDVRKVEIIDFFHGFQLLEDRVILLQDEQGAGLGEALISFQSEKEAVMAQSLNGQRFLGSEVILTCITRSQMQEFDITDGNIPERSSQGNPRRFNEKSDFPSDQRYVESRDVMPDVPRYDRGNDRPFDRFEKPDTYSLEPSSPELHRHGPSDQQLNGPSCVKLLNLPFNIRVDEIYDFCYGYRVIPGSVSLQYDRTGTPTGTATVVFESYNEALIAVEELNGRPIGTRNVNVEFV